MWINISLYLLQICEGVSPANDFSSNFSRYQFLFPSHIPLAIIPPCLDAYRAVQMLMAVMDLSPILGLFSVQLD